MNYTTLISDDEYIRATLAAEFATGLVKVSNSSLEVEYGKVHTTSGAFDFGLTTYHSTPCSNAFVWPIKYSIVLDMTV